ncbi:hypothetical protein TNCV_2235111 [Trichonephila clavipes]|nr:hypothetical protein TNCV_2235111 [Trichonephila clavipes]
MNLPAPTQIFNKKESGLDTAVETVALASMQIAAKKKPKMSADILIYQLLLMCPNKMHNENCKANHFGNSESMEVSGAIENFQRSESLHGLRYTKFLADGDARAYKAVN